MGQTNIRTRRETCINCSQRSQCILPLKDTEDESTALYICDRFKASK